MNILALSPHTDDIELGCGGSLTRWMKEGHNVSVVVFSLCEKSIPEEFPKDITELEFKRSMNLLGANYDIKYYPVRDFPQHRQAILEDMRRLKGYDLVVAPSLNDIHQDHKVIAEEARRAFRCSILSYELPYTTLNFNPNFYIKLDKKDLDNKKELLRIYKSQIHKGKGYTGNEYIYGLSKVRGAQIDAEFAEAFEVIRWVL